MKLSIYRLSPKIIYDSVKGILISADQHTQISVAYREQLILNHLLLCDEEKPEPIDALLDVIYPDPDDAGNISVLYNLMSSLRNKMLELGEHEQIIKNKSKLGYFINQPKEPEVSFEQFMSVTNKSECEHLAMVLENLAEAETRSDKKESLRRSAAIFKLYSSNPSDDNK